MPAGQVNLVSKTMKFDFLCMFFFRWRRRKYERFNLTCESSFDDEKAKTEPVRTLHRQVKSTRWLHVDRSPQSTNILDKREIEATGSAIAAIAFSTMETSSR